MKAILFSCTLTLFAAVAVLADDTKDSKDSKTTKDTKDAKEAKPKDPKDVRETKDPFESYAEESLKALEKAGDILAGVKDRKSAEEARPKLMEIAKPLGELKRKLAESEPTKERRAELAKKYKHKFEEAIKRFREQAVRVAGEEGGKELLDELDRLLKPLVPKKG